MKAEKKNMQKREKKEGRKKKEKKGGKQLQKERKHTSLHTHKKQNGLSDLVRSLGASFHRVWGVGSWKNMS